MRCEILKSSLFKTQPERLDLVVHEVHHHPHLSSERHHARHQMHRQAVAVTHAAAVLNRTRNVIRVAPTGLRTKVIAESDAS